MMYINEGTNGKKDTEEAACKQVEEHFQGIYSTNHPFIDRVLVEVLLHHKWLSIATHYAPHYPRHLRIIGIWTTILSMLFMQTIFYSTRNQDDGSCKSYSTYSPFLFFLPILAIFAMLAIFANFFICWFFPIVRYRICLPRAWI